jgi:hypothetical protein
LFIFGAAAEENAEFAEWAELRGEGFALWLLLPWGAA